MRPRAPVCLAALAVSAFFTPGPTVAQAPASDAPGPSLYGALTLSGVVARALDANLRLRAMHAAAEAASARRPEASTLPDPMLQLGIMNVGLPDFNADMPASMAPSVQLMQMFPFPGKLGLKGDIATLDEAMAVSALNEMGWEVRAMAATMFYDLYALDRRIEVMDETLTLLRNFRQVARAMYASGMGRQADVLRGDVEVASMDGEIRSMSAMRRAMAARLNALLDLPAEAPVGSPVLDALPATLPSRDTLIAWAVTSRPLLARGRQAVEQAGSRVALARRELWPDITVGVAYGQRDAGMGTERMGSAMVGFSLPIFASRRQHAMRDEALAMERMADAELGSLQAEVTSSVEVLLAEAERGRSLALLYRDEILPEARATVASALSSYRVGSVDFMTLVDAQMAVNDFEGAFHQLLADYGKALAGLESAVARPMPSSEHTLVGTR